MSSLSDTADAIRKKVERAEYHIEDFKSALGLGGGSPILGYAADVHEDGHGNLVCTTDVPVPGLENGIIVGDLVHQLRSCLDHIAYAMVKPVCTDDRTLRRITFPVFYDPTEFTNSLSFKTLTDVLGSGSKQIAEIRRSQPYERDPISPKSDPLWVISKLDNIDKHRTILVLNPTISVSGRVKSHSGDFPFVARKQPIKAGTAVLNLSGPLPHPPREVEVERISPFIVFAETEGLCDNLSVFPLFRKMIKAITRVTNSFESKRLI